uniref:Uncharacterized protein n=1 Tax=Knipowitschia caucasica TaxID=637954 RepID=A0AAV2MTC4_KNICA
MLAGPSLLSPNSGSSLAAGEIVGDPRSWQGRSVVPLSSSGPGFVLLLYAASPSLLTVSVQRLLGLALHSERDCGNGTEGFAAEKRLQGQEQWGASLRRALSESGHSKRD